MNSLKGEYLQPLKMQATPEQRRGVTSKEISGELEAKSGGHCSGGKGKSEGRGDKQVRLLESLAWLKAWQGLPREAELQFRGEGTVTLGKGNGKPTSVVVGKRGARQGHANLFLGLCGSHPFPYCPFSFPCFFLQAGPQNS